MQKRQCFEKNSWLSGIVLSVKGESMLVCSKEEGGGMGAQHICGARHAYTRTHTQPPQLGLDRSVTAVGVLANAAIDLLI